MPRPACIEVGSEFTTRNNRSPPNDLDYDLTTENRLKGYCSKGISPSRTPYLIRFVRSWPNEGTLY